MGVCVCVCVYRWPTVGSHTGAHTSHRHRNDKHTHKEGRNYLRGITWS